MKQTDRVRNYRNPFHIVRDHLETNIGDELKKCNATSNKCVVMLEYTFGAKVFDQIDGFIKYAKEHNFSDFQIKTTLLHDVGGALNRDKLMLPRVSEYGKYSTIKSKNHLL